MEEAEKIQMRYATDLLTVGTDDLADRVEKRKAVFSRQRKDELIREGETFHVLEIVNPKRRKDVYWALSEDCEHFLCPDGDPVIPASVVVELRCYQPRKDFILRLRPYGIGVFGPETMTAFEAQPDAETDAEAGSAMMTPQQIPTPGSGINFVWFESKRIPKKWGGPTTVRAQTPQDSRGLDVAPLPSIQTGDLPTTQAALSSIEKPVAGDPEKRNFGTEKSDQISAPSIRDLKPSLLDKPEKEIKNE
jgi:hypothetical protein